MSTKADITTKVEAEAGAVPVGRGARALSRATVGVLGGGRSGEREVSLLTQAAVIEALGSPALEPRPRRVLSIEVERDGRWRVEGHSSTPAAALAALGSVDVFFLALHGGEGEDGTLQGLLEANDRAYTGSGVGASAVAMDKGFARTLLAAEGLRVPRGLVVTGATWRSNPEGVRDCIRALAEGEEQAAWFIKPRSGGSSLATSWLRGTGALAGPLGEALEAVFEGGDQALVELAVRGVEVSVGVLQPPAGWAQGEDGGRPLALTPIEIEPHAERFFDYTEKYRSDGAQEFCPPRSLSTEVQEHLRSLALAAHHSLRCRGFSRSDFIVPPDGEPYFLETNTLPGLMERSLLPQEAALHGIDYPHLCQWILLDALERRRSAGPGESA